MGARFPNLGIADTDFRGLAVTDPKSNTRTRIDVRLGGRCQWVLDAVCQTVEWPSQPLRFDSVVLRTTTRQTQRYALL
jgi:hypothetical protein